MKRSLSIIILSLALAVFDSILSRLSSSSLASIVNFAQQDAGKQSIESLWIVQINVMSGMHDAQTTCVWVTGSSQPFDRFVAAILVHPIDAPFAIDERDGQRVW